MTDLTKFVRQLSGKKAMEEFASLVKYATRENILATVDKYAVHYMSCRLTYGLTVVVYHQLKIVPA